MCNEKAGGEGWYRNKRNGKEICNNKMTNARLNWKRNNGQDLGQEEMLKRHASKMADKRSGLLKQQ
jgi:hypothetical protein